MKNVKQIKNKSRGKNKKANFDQKAKQLKYIFRINVTLDSRGACLCIRKLFHKLVEAKALALLANIF